MNHKMSFDKEFDTLTNIDFGSRVYSLLKDVEDGKRIDELKANNFSNLKLLYARNYSHKQSIAINNLNSISDLVGYVHGKKVEDQ
jgi:hypothetical protein